MHAPVQTAATLTDRERETLCELIALLERDGFPPSLRQLASELGRASGAGVRNHLKTLQQKGYLHIEPKCSRGIRVLMRPDGQRFTHAWNRVTDLTGEEVGHA